jgi:hypothetical protein
MAGSSRLCELDEETGDGSGDSKFDAEGKVRGRFL